VPRQSSQKLLLATAVAQVMPPSMPSRAPAMKPARRPWRFMNQDAGKAISAVPIT
jgi:hypothetical protein